MKKKLITGVATMALTGILLTSSVFAENMNNNMTTNKMDAINTMPQATVFKYIKIKVNGEEKIIKDEKGMQVYPLMYHNRVYLPIRGISETLGAKIDWDVTTRSVMIGGMMTDNKMMTDDKMMTDNKMMTNDKMMENMMTNVTIAKDVKIMLNGAAVDIKDENGMMIYPIIYQDRVYIPIRGVADALGVSINWDKASKSVMIDKM